MPEFKVTKSWYIKAKTTVEAIEKSKNYDHIHITASKCNSNKHAEHNISIKTLLEKALRHLKIQQWVDSKYFDVASKNLFQAISLIELVEIYDCGSIGGFGKGQLITNEKGTVYTNMYHPIFARFLWLYEKYVEKGKGNSLPTGIAPVASLWRKN